MRVTSYHLKPMTLLLASFLMSIPLASLAEHEHEHHRQYEAHVHGAGTLNWVIEGQMLNISLKSPVINMLGFEHNPKNDGEKQQAALMIENLNDTTKVLEFTGGQCELISTIVINPFEKVFQYEKIETVNSGEKTHTEVTAEYQFLCKQPSELDTIKIKLFDTFSGFEIIDSQWIVDGKQGGTQLNYTNHTLKVH